MEVLNASMMKRFEDHMVKHIAQSYPDQFHTLNSLDAGDGNVRALIRDGIEKGKSYGIEAEGDVKRFIDLMIKVAPEFDTLDEMQWAKVILDDMTLSGHVKIKLIGQLLPGRLPKR